MHVVRVVVQRVDPLGVALGDVALVRLRGEQVAPTEAAALTDAFFGLLTGKVGAGIAPSEVRLTALAELFADSENWDGEEWQGPTDKAILASQGVDTEALEVEALAAAPNGF